jgi:hypothetical protein
MLNLFPCLFLMMVVDAFLILNAIMYWLCSSPIALYGELRIHGFLKVQYRLKILPKFIYRLEMHARVSFGIVMIYQWRLKKNLIDLIIKIRQCKGAY